MSSLEIQSDFTRQRQRRFLDWMNREWIELAVVTRPEHVQYLTGFRPHRLMVAVAAMTSDGRVTLAAPNREPDRCQVDEVVTFPAQYHSTLRQDQHFAAADAMMGTIARPGATLGKVAGAIAGAVLGAVEVAVGGQLPSAVQRCAIEFSAAGEGLKRGLAGSSTVIWVDAEPELWRLRRWKDPDELALIERAVSCTERMYARAREILRPGISELQVYGALYDTAVQSAGEPLLDFGNDFQCASPGGPPRDRAAEAGELYILDLGLSYRGYYADNCRTFAVGAAPTSEQSEAWSAIVDVLSMIEREVRPGVGCRSIFERAQAMLDSVRPGAFHHHLGHGIGLFPHEAPRLNPNWDETFQVGEVFTAEPGLYWESLRAGIRVEDDYLVTESGVRRLSHFPRELTS